MTVANELCEVTRTWTGVETSFAAGFQALDANHVVVTFIDVSDVHTVLTAGVHYTAALDTSGYVTVTPLSLPAAPATLLISRVTPATQGTSFAGLVDFSSSVHESLADASAMRDAEERRDIAKAFTAANATNASAAAAAASAILAQSWAIAAQAYAGVPSTGVFLKGSFTGNGATTAFDLTYPIVTAARLQWIEDGVPQEPGVDFTIAGNIVTRTTAPRNGAKIFWVLGGQMAGAMAASIVTDDSNVGGVTVKGALNAIWAFLAGVVAGIVSASRAVVVDANKDVGIFRNVGVSGQLQDANGNELLKFITTGSAVNEVSVGNASAGGSPQLVSTGGDTNIPITLSGKGTGPVALGQATSSDVRLVADQPLADSSGNEYLKFGKVASAVNEMTLTNAATGAPASLKASGGDTNISQRLGGKGSGLVQSDTRFLQAGAAASYNTAGAVTYTAADLLGGIVVRDCNGAGRTDVLPTAALLVAAIPNAKIGDIVQVLIVNGTNGAFAITVNAGAGGAFDANQAAATRTIAQNTSKWLQVRLTSVTPSSEAYVAYL